MSESKGIVIEEQELRETTKTPTTCVWTGMGRCM